MARKSVFVNRTKRYQTLRKTLRLKKSLKALQPIQPPLIPEDLLSGYRICNLRHVLLWALPLQSEHNKVCADGILRPCEEKRKGLFSEIVFRCDKCVYEVVHGTEPVDKDDGKIRSNHAAVWAVTSSGGTYTNLKNWLGVMDIPSFTFGMFRNIDLEFYEGMRIASQITMQTAAEVEKTMAIQKNQIDSSGTPWIRVNLDGAWSQRSYGHSYNANSCAGVVIGRVTRKVVDMDTRNSYCIICATATNANLEPRQHECFKNWNGSSGAMEASIIVQCFNRSLVNYGLKYREFIADGDSSVYNKIRTECPYGMEVIKIECKNHVLKNYGKALYALKSKSSVKLDARKQLTVKRIKELQDACSKILNVHAQGDVAELQKDLANSPKHVYGNHKKCLKRYCDKVGGKSKIWFNVKKSGVIAHIEGALQRILQKGHLIVENETNNAAESFMSLLCKYAAGKRLNLSHRNTFNGRAYAAVLRYNETYRWQTIVWEKVMGEPPGQYFQTFLRSQKLQDEANKRGHVRNDRKVTASATAARKRRTAVDLDYGPNVPELDHLLDAKVLKEEKSQKAINQQQLCKKDYMEENHCEVIEENLCEVVEEENLCEVVDDENLYEEVVVCAGVDQEILIDDTII